MLSALSIGVATRIRATIRPNASALAVPRSGQGVRAQVQLAALPDPVQRIAPSASRQIRSPASSTPPGQVRPMVSYVFSPLGTSAVDTA